MLARDNAGHFSFVNLNYADGMASRVVEKLTFRIVEDDSPGAGQL